MAVYIVRLSAKLCFIVGMLKEICLDLKEKVIIFTDWPITTWNLESLLIMLGINVMCLRLTISLSHRSDAMRRFNNPDDPVKVLLTGLKIPATSLNLQGACHFVIFADMPSNAQTFLQGGGRVMRRRYTGPRPTLASMTYDLPNPIL